VTDHMELSFHLDAVSSNGRPPVLAAGAAKKHAPPGQCIAVAQDRAFSFLYPHLLDRWRAAGAEILAFSPLGDEAPDPRADCVWLPGGYPELHAATLASAYRFHAGLRALAARAVPIHGECGGYMVLGQGIEDAHGERHAMAGLLGLETSFATRRLHLGYRRARLRSACALGTRGGGILGHEFHYASVLSRNDEALVDCQDAAGGGGGEGGGGRGGGGGRRSHPPAGGAAG